MAKSKVPVSKAALFRRINRRLAQDDEVLKTTRGARAIMDLGEYYVLDWRRNWATHKDVDPEGLGRELGVLKEWERVEGL